MAGINFSGKNRKVARIASELASFLFEEEFGELRNFSKSEIETLHQASRILCKHI